jgi:hypothetical protein
MVDDKLVLDVEDNTDVNRLVVDVTDDDDIEDLVFDDTSMALGS